MRMKQESEKAELKLNIQKTKITAPSPLISSQTDGGKMETVADFIFLGSKITADSDYSHVIKRFLLLGRKATTKVFRQHIKKQRHHFADKGPYGQSYGFSNSHVWMWVVGPQRRLSAKQLMLAGVVLEKILECPLDSKEIKPVNPKGNQPWIFIGRTDDEALIFRPPDAKRQLTGKDPDVGKDWRQETRTTEDEMVGWHHRVNGHQF